MSDPLTLINNFLSLLDEYIKESKEIGPGYSYERHEAGIGLKSYAKFATRKGTFATKKELWIYVYKHLQSYDNKISTAFIKPIDDISSWEGIVQRLEEKKEQMEEEMNPIKDSWGWNKFSNIRDKILMHLNRYITSIKYNVIIAKETENRNEQQRRNRSLFRTEEQLERERKAKERERKAREYKRAIALRRTQQEKARELAAEKKRKEDMKKSMRTALNRARAAMRIRKGACKYRINKVKTLDRELKKYETAAERQKQYNDKNHNWKKCLGVQEQYCEADRNRLDAYRKQIEDIKTKKQTAETERNNTCGSLKLKF